MLGHYRTSPLHWTGETPVFRNNTRKSPWSGISPQQLGELGGELSKVMVQAAADFMARKALDEANQAFQEVVDGKPDSHPSS